MFYSTGCIGASSSGGVMTEFGIGKTKIPVAWDLSVTCPDCGQLQINHVDDVAYPIASDKRMHKHCPTCGNHNLVFVAELENGQMIYRCRNCGSGLLAVHKNAIFVEATAEQAARIRSRRNAIVLAGVQLGTKLRVG